MYTLDIMKPRRSNACYNLVVIFYTFSALAQIVDVDAATGASEFRETLRRCAVDSTEPEV